MFRALHVLSMLQHDACCALWQVRCTAVGLRSGSACACGMSHMQHGLHGVAALMHNRRLRAAVCQGPLVKLQHDQSQHPGTGLAYADCWHAVWPCCRLFAGLPAPCWLPQHCTPPRALVSEHRTQCQLACSPCFSSACLTGPCARLSRSSNWLAVCDPFNIHMVCQSHVAAGPTAHAPFNTFTPGLSHRCCHRHTCPR